MPVEGYLEYENGEIEILEDTNAGELLYVGDYEEAGRISRLIGVECPKHDLGAIVHVVDDERTLESFCPANAGDAFSTETQIGWLVPDGSCSIEIINRLGRCATLVMNHKLPFTQSPN